MATNLATQHLLTESFSTDSEFGLHLPPCRIRAHKLVCCIKVNLFAVKVMLVSAVEMQCVSDTTRRYSIKAPVESKIHCVFLNPAVFLDAGVVARYMSPLERISPLLVVRRRPFVRPASQHIATKIADLWCRPWQFCEVSTQRCFQGWRQELHRSAISLRNSSIVHRPVCRAFDSTERGCWYLSRDEKARARRRSKRALPRRH